ncbi:hypothetical protein ACHAWF_001618 [Thalassiosira exigua]
MSDDDVMDLRSSMTRDPTVMRLVQRLETSSLVSVGVGDSAAGVDESPDESRRSGVVDDSERSSSSMLSWSDVSARETPAGDSPVGEDAADEVVGGGEVRDPGRSGLWGSALLPMGAWGGDAPAAPTEAPSSDLKKPAPAGDLSKAAQRRLRLRRCFDRVMILAALAAFSGCIVYILEFYILPGEILGSFARSDIDEDNQGRVLPIGMPQAQEMEGVDWAAESGEEVDAQVSSVEERIRRVQERRRRRARRAKIMEMGDP